jgi:drug/metabolite transporter (DMT)-like permease
VLAVSVVAALAAGCTFAVGSVLQQSAAREAPASVSMSWRLLVDLAHRRTWLLGISCDVGSFALQALALAFGPLALVQPLLVTGLLFAVPLAVRWRGRRLGPREWAGTIAVGAGLAAFLAASSPTDGVPQTTWDKWVMILIAVGGLMAMGIAVGGALTGALRASAYGLSAGVAFGLLAALTKASTHLLSQGAGVFFTSLQPYSMAFFAVAGAIVQQSAFQAGPLPASVPIMDAAEPTVAVLIGVFAFAEHVATSTAALAFEALGILLVLAGIVTLDRSPIVLELGGPASEDQPDHQPASRARSSSAKSGNREATVSSGNSS